MPGENMELSLQWLSDEEDYPDLQRYINIYKNNQSYLTQLVYLYHESSFVSKLKITMGVIIVGWLIGIELCSISASIVFIAAYALTHYVLANHYAQEQKNQNFFCDILNQSVSSDCQNIKKIENDLQDSLTDLETIIDNKTLDQNVFHSSCEVIIDLQKKYSDVMQNILSASELIQQQSISIDKSEKFDVLIQSSDQSLDQADNDFAIFDKLMCDIKLDILDLTPKEFGIKV